MGYNIEKYHAFEIDPKVRAVVRCHTECNVVHLEPNDALKIRTSLGEVCTDVIATPECAPWSRANGKVVPKGSSDARVKLFKKAAAIIKDQQKRNPQLNVLFENMEIHPRLPTDAAEQERLLKGRFSVSNACDLGGMSSRPRHIHSNMADAQDLIHRKPS